MRVHFQTSIWKKVNSREGRFFFFFQIRLFRKLQLISSNFTTFRFDPIHPFFMICFLNNQISRIISLISKVLKLFSNLTNQVHQTRFCSLKSSQEESSFNRKLSVSHSSFILESETLEFHIEPSKTVSHNKKDPTNPNPT